MTRKSGCHTWLLNKFQTDVISIRIGKVLVRPTPPPRNSKFWHQSTRGDWNFCWIYDGRWRGLGGTLIRFGRWWMGRGLRGWSLLIREKLGGSETIANRPPWVSKLSVLPNCYWILLETSSSISSSSSKILLFSWIAKSKKLAFSLCKLLSFIKLDSRSSTAYWLIPPAKKSPRPLFIKFEFRLAMLGVKSCRYLQKDSCSPLIYLVAYFTKKKESKVISYLPFFRTGGKSHPAWIAPIK